MYLVKGMKIGAETEKAVSSLHELMILASHHGELRGFFKFWNDTINQFSHA